MKKLITGIGWLLVVPFIIGLAVEIHILGKLIFISDYNQDQMGSTELAYGGLFLLFAGVVALVGVSLIRRGRGHDKSAFVGVALGAGLGLVGGGVLNGGLIVGVVAATVGSALGGLMVTRSRSHAVETANPDAVG